MRFKIKPKWVFLFAAIVMPVIVYIVSLNISKIENVDKNGVVTWAHVTTIYTKTKSKLGFEMGKFYSADFDWKDSQGKARHQKKFSMTESTAKSFLYASSINKGQLKIKYLPNKSFGDPIIVKDMAENIKDYKFTIMMLLIFCGIAFVGFIGALVYEKRGGRKVS